MYMRFWVSIGAETFQKVRNILLEGAKEYDLDVEFTQSGDKILDLEVKLSGDLGKVDSYLDWFCDIIALYIRKER
jgi:hypothetical protein